ncbi:hypothetical protein LPJ61_000899 [Coemansia biformis]|uniref:DNA replication checkpoint mediator MRC1 domain-containing protein n=1 Tax=Coemansia biformis TaxID=1286918 RepID=A0A9W7YFV9_9FUNG|nr:hypothetical protein LPJ61_000899 [Coemansia biformis]
MTEDGAQEPTAAEQRAAPVEFNIGSSALLGAFAHGDAPQTPSHGGGSNDGAGNGAGSASKYDPVAQLMASDTSDSEHGDGKRGGGAGGAIRGQGLASAGARSPEPQALLLGVDGKGQTRKAARRRRLNANSFRLDRSATKASVVARMAPARRRRAVDDESSDSDSGGSAQSSPLKPKPRNMQASPGSEPSSAAEHSASDSDPADGAELGEERAVAPRKKNSVTGGGAKTESGGARSPRAASKAAMDMIHRESERLVRETAVVVDPADFTRRLSLDDFFERFNTRSMGAQARQTPKQITIRPVEMKGTFSFSVGDDDAEVVIIEDPLAHQSQAAAPALARPVRKTGTQGQVQEHALDAILDYGTQPLHVSAQRTGPRCTDGPLALKSLNSALLNLVYKRDTEAKLAQAEKKARRQRDTGVKPGLVTREQPANDRALNEMHDMAEEGGDSGEDSGEDAAYSDSGSSNADSIDDDEACDGTATQSRRRAAVSSDDDSDAAEEGSDVPRPMADSAQLRVAAGDDGPTTAAAKTKFLGMFRMPAREAAINADRCVAAPAASIPQSEKAEDVTQSQQDCGLGQSQDLPDLFTSQHGSFNTQDSLLLTPDAVGATQELGAVRDGDPAGDMLHYLGGYTQSSQRAGATGSTQPTQPMTATSPAMQSQLTVPTMATAQSSAAVSVLPSMVRRALDPAHEASVGDAESEFTSPAGSPPPLQDETDPPEEAVRSLLPRGQGRRILRRGGGEPARATRKRLKRSEFVEAEAEEGESSGSEGEPGAAMSRKFNWSNGDTGAARADSEGDDDDLDMDTDEEEAALLADPMIDNDVDEDGEGDQAIRDLHRRQDFDQDERDIQELFKDVTTGGLRSRGLRGRTGLGLADEEDYIDRQTRAERMEERQRQRRKLLAREIHDTNLAEIAKNPETAAFAQAALMRAPTAGAPGEDTDAEDVLLDDGGFELEEEVDEHSVAATVQRHLARGGRHVDSDADSDVDGSQHSGEASDWRPASRVAGSDHRLQSLGSDDLADDGLGGGVFSSVAVEKLIVRRRPLAAGGRSADPLGAAWRPPAAQRLPLKRAGGASVAAVPAKRPNMSGE